MPTRRTAPRPIPILNGRRVWIPKPVKTKEQRPLGVPVVRDRVIGGITPCSGPIFERDFAEQSYGFRPGRNCLHALQRVEELLMKGYTWIVDVDLKSYFDTIPRKQLLGEIQKRIVDGKVLKLLESYLEAGSVGNRERDGSQRNMAPRKGQSSARCYPTSISIPWITRWPRRVMRWCGTRMMLWCVAALKPKHKRLWQKSRCGPQRLD